MIAHPDRIETRRLRLAGQIEDALAVITTDHGPASQPLTDHQPIRHPAGL